MGFFNPVMAFMGHNGEEDGTQVSEKAQSLQDSSAAEENYGTPTKQPTSEVDASQEAETAQSPKQPSKLEENHKISTESAASKVDVSEQPRTPQTPTHPSAAEENGDNSNESPTPKGDASEVAVPSQSPTHQSPTEENHNGSSETISSIRKEGEHHQDREQSSPSDEASVTQLGESGGDTSDASPANLDQSSNTEMAGSIHTGKEDMDDANVSQPQLVDSMPGNSDDVNEAEVKIVEEPDALTEINATQDNSDTTDEVTSQEAKVHDDSINTAENEEESNQMAEGVASVVLQDDNAREQLQDLRSKSINVEHDSDSRNGLEATSEDTPAKPIEVVLPASDFRNEEKKHESVISTGSVTPQLIDSVVELEKLRREMKMMEAALQGAARQSQVYSSYLWSLLSIQLAFRELELLLYDFPLGREHFLFANPYMFVVERK